MKGSEAGGHKWEDTTLRACGERRSAALSTDVWGDLLDEALLPALRIGRRVGAHEDVADRLDVVHPLEEARVRAHRNDGERAQHDVAVTGDRWQQKSRPGRASTYTKGKLMAART